MWYDVQRYLPKQCRIDGISCTVQYTNILIYHFNILVTYNECKTTNIRKLWNISIE